tara:strand:+ start:580 stop:864 length:285 start_codon:yes stop_codon:yes gene_type:complete
MLLQTYDPDVAKYNLVFGKSLIDYQQGSESIDAQLTQILQKDKNTENCSVVPGSMNWGEPGSQGTAIVSCEATINMERQEVYGGPLYSYKLSEL